MIDKQKLTLTSQIDQLELHANVYVPDNPKAIVQIFHGMAEHKERYDEFCNILARLNCVVLISDLRGHGESINEQIPLGYFADKKGWLAQISDLDMFSQHIREQFRNLPYFVMGHSMGSLLACSYLKRHEDALSGVVLSGMPAYSKKTPAGKKLAKMIASVSGPKKHSNILIKAASPFNDAIKNPRTEFDWLSYNTENVDRYIEDPLCGFPFTNLGYYDLMSGMEDVFLSKDWRVLKRNLPIYFCVGQDDPCADVPEGFRNSMRNLEHAGYQNISAAIFENMRHEILQEKERKIPYKDILTWIDDKIKAINNDYDLNI